jgi:hypothetical protein
MAKSSSRVRPLVWVYVSAAAFLVTLLGAVAYVVFAGQLSFIPNWLYYLMLFPVGLAAAAFLSGALRSHAKFTGKLSYGTIELTGPAVVAGLVIVGGMLLANRETTFALTVRVSGPGGPADLVRTGSVMLDVGQSRRSAPISADGQVVFAEVASSLAGEAIRLIPDVPGFEAGSADPVRIPANHVVDLALKRVVYATPMSGVVTDANDRIVSGAVVSFGGGAATDSTDARGHFALSVPFAPGTVVPVSVEKGGRILLDNTVTVAEQPALRLRITRE